MAALPLLAFFLLSCLFHYRAFTEGLLLAPPDAPDNDALRLNYPLKHLYAYALKNLEFPLWNPFAFAGIPFVAEMHVGVLYPLNLVMYFALPSPYAFNLSYLLHLALGGYFAYLYLRLIGLGGLPSFAGGMVFGFTGFLISNKDHTAIVNSAAYLPLIMCFFERLRRRPDAANAMLVALAVAIQILAGNMQVCVYTYMTVGMFIVFYAARKAAGRDGGGWAGFLAMGGLGMSLGFVIALPQLVATAELSGLSWMEHSRVYRGYEYFSLYHVYFSTLPQLLSPHLFVGWGPKDDTLILLGALPVALSIAAAAEARRNHFAFFWATVVFIGLVLALGDETPLGRLMYRLPVYSTFRAHGRNLLEVTMGVAVLFALGLDAVLARDARGERVSGRALAVLLCALLLLLAASAAAAFLPLGGLTRLLAAQGFQRPELLAGQVSLRSASVLLPLMFIVGYSAWIISVRKQGGALLRYAALALLAAEAFYIGGFKNIEGPRLAEAEDLCQAELYREEAGRPEPFRIANIAKFPSVGLNPSANLTCRVGSVNAYEPLALDDYSVLLDLWLSGFYTHRWSDIAWNNTVLSMLGVKYIKVTREADFEMHLMRAEGGERKVEDVPITGWRIYDGEELGAGAMRLRKDGLALSGPLALRAGTYEISASLRAPGGAKGRFTATVVAAANQSRQEVLHIIPDRMGPDLAEFHQVFRSGGDDLYMLELLSFSETPIDVKAVRLRRLAGYAPFSLAREGTEALASPYLRVGEDKASYLYLNRNVLPRAWAVKRLVPADGIEDIKRKLFALEVNPAEEAMLGRDDMERIGETEFSAGEVKLVTLGMNEVLLRTKFPGEGFVVLSEQFYPGWRAFVDGAETGIYRTNGLMRGVVVPPGEHKVEFLYRPGRLMALLALGALMSALAVAVVAARGTR